jgi:hypothetical protein
MSPNPRGNIAATARAFATYSLVPYLGILFCPGAVLVGTFGLLTSYRSNVSAAPNRTVCFASVIVGLIVLFVQLFLWWILYKVPIWAKGIS